MRRADKHSIYSPLQRPFSPASPHLLTCAHYTPNVWICLNTHTYSLIPCAAAHWAVSSIPIGRLISQTVGNSIISLAPGKERQRRPRFENCIAGGYYRFGHICVISQTIRYDVYIHTHTHRGPITRTCSISSRGRKSQSPDLEPPISRPRPVRVMAAREAAAAAAAAAAIVLLPRQRKGSLSFSRKSGGRNVRGGKL